MFVQVRAASARERQVWVDRLRHCVYLQSRGEAGGEGGEGVDTARTEQTLPLTASDAFGSVQQQLEKVYAKQASLDTLSQFHN